MFRNKKSSLPRPSHPTKDARCLRPEPRRGVRCLHPESRRGTSPACPGLAGERAASQASRGARPCQLVSILAFISASFPLPQLVLPLRPQCALCLDSARFPLPQAPVFSAIYKRVRNSGCGLYLEPAKSLKTSTFKSLYFQAVAHSLSLFSCKSCICNSYAKQPPGYTPISSRKGVHRVSQIR